ncbi:mucoidy inhibitor MuiA family protein [Hymenobacter perfusus]|uniref:Mucoidy inhibitor MuiA family protein n=1 Tax=Hymenobacter perfusus TaxID=1236770 RepID=A0A3R9NYX1_9BACT|nr:mucoidy inhibitor MuiA family protein [Hymenobacter perfusus]
MRLLLLCVFLTCGGSVRAQQIIKTRLPLRSVTLALNQAELQHQGTVALPAGRTVVVVEEVARMSAESIQVEASDNAELIAVERKVERGPQSAGGRDSITLLDSRVRRLEAELKGLEEEKAFLLANRTLPAGMQAGWSSEVQKGAALLRTRLPDIQTQTETLTAQRDQLNRQRERLRNGPGANPQVHIILNLARPATVQLTLRYTESSSSWEAMPEIRVPESGRELRLRTRAEVYNGSGLPWANVRLAIRNEEVENDVTRPELTTWSMNFKRSLGGEGRVDKFVVKGKATGNTTAPAEPSSAYVVPQSVSVAAGETYQIQLPEQVLPARPEYLAIPKLSDKVYLQAKVSGWDKLNLPVGELETNVFYQGSYVGTTAIDSRAFNDSLEISLGHDDQIVVSRTKTLDFNGKAGLGSQQISRVTYELNLRNRHAQPVRVRVLDQIPVSQEQDLRVKLDDAGGAQLEEANGRLTWLVNLAPGASQRLRFTFTVEYPKDKTVDFQRPRRVASPKFR